MRHRNRDRIRWEPVTRGLRGHVLVGTDATAPRAPAPAPRQAVPGAV